MSILVEMKPRSVNLNASNVTKNINDLKSDGILQTLADYVKERKIIYHVIAFASTYVGVCKVSLLCLKEISFQT